MEKQKLIHKNTVERDKARMVEYVQMILKYMDTKIQINRYQTELSHDRFGRHERFQLNNQNVYDWNKKKINGHRNYSWLW